MTESLHTLAAASAAFSALVLMTPLALTSTDAMLKRLGGRRWRQLHRLVYLITAAGVAHFWWLVKKDISQPVIFAVLLMISLAIRAFYARQSGEIQRVAKPRS